MKDLIKGVITSIWTFIVYLIGGIDNALITLAIMMMADYITGVISAIYNKELNSKVGLIGILKKALYFIVIIVAQRVDMLLGFENTMRSLVIYFFVANDGISILENLCEMNIPVPKKLKEVLEQLRKDNE